MTSLDYIYQSLYMQNRLMLLCISFWTDSKWRKEAEPGRGVFFHLFWWGKKGRKEGREWSGAEQCRWGENCGHRQAEACTPSALNFLLCPQFISLEVACFNWSNVLKHLTVCPFTFIPSLHWNKECVKWQQNHNSCISRCISASLNMQDLLQKKLFSKEFFLSEWQYNESNLVAGSIDAKEEKEHSVKWILIWHVVQQGRKWRR